MKLKTLLLATSILTPISVPVFAQDANAWGGFYGGIGYSPVTTGDIEEYSSMYPVANSPENPFEVFGGYNWTSGQMVYGVELSAGPGAIWEDGSSGFGIDQLVDLRGRVGYATGNWLMYGALSASFAEYNYGTFASASASGFGVGLGASYKVTDKIFIGSEVLFRSMDASEDLPVKGGSFFDFGGEFTTMSLRVGYLF